MTDSTTAQMTPADGTTRELMRIWRDLLCVDAVGTDQNYFDLGGDSALAVEMFTRIEREFKVKLPLAILFEASTIDELARVIRTETSTSTSGWSPLVAIQPNGIRPRFFCMHGAGGNVLIYRELAQHLGEDQPFFGLQAQGLDGSCPPLATVEEMATLYAKEIRKFQPRGPYFIGGYCMGGTLAYEVARQLRLAGEEIGLLALFDTMNWCNVGPPNSWTNAYHAIEKVSFHAANFFQLNGSGRREFIREKLRDLRDRLPIWKGIVSTKLSKDAEATSQSHTLARVWQANDRACLIYLPKPFPGVVTDFRPSRQYRMFNLPNLKWEQLAQGGQRVVNLPVYPAGMLVEPFVQHLAKNLRSAIDAAMRNAEGAM